MALDVDTDKQFDFQTYWLHLHGCLMEAFAVACEAWQTLRDHVYVPKGVIVGASALLGVFFQKSTVLVHFFKKE